MPIRSIKRISATGCIGLWEMTEHWQELEKLTGLGAENLAPLQQISKDSRKAEWLACRALIREILGIEPVVFHNSDRKPHLKNDAHELSMSHSGAFACVYTSENGAVGVDIQQMKPSISKGMDYFLKNEEKEWIDSDDNVLLHLIWSAKESVFKYAGDPDIDLKKHLTVKSFDRNQNETFEVTILREHTSDQVLVGHETFDDYVLTWTC